MRATGKNTLQALLTS